MRPAEILELMNRQDRRVVAAVASEGPRIVRAASWMAAALARSGRAVFVGAGTSGRLGVLEAAECPPTFGTDPGQIVALMAGGNDSVFRSREGAEDDGQAAMDQVAKLEVTAADLVVGISASSVTPFVGAAVGSSRRRGAKTVLVTCGRRPRGLVDLVIAPKVGAELIAGSTRLKAGTATKLVLNQMTVLAMVRSNKVHGPFMVDVMPSSRKLHDRALRIVARLANVDRSRAKELVDSCGGHVKTAVLVGRSTLAVAEATTLLATCKGNLRRALKRVASDV